MTMPKASQYSPSGGSEVANPWMFFRRWVANPLQMGSVIPSSPASAWRYTLATAAKF